MGRALDTPVSLSQRALSHISASELEYPNKNILEAFINDAVDPELAAEYLLRFTGSDKRNDYDLPKDLELSHFLNDWKVFVNASRSTACKGLARDIKAIVRARDGGRCSITGLQPRFFHSQLVLATIVSPSAFGCVHDSSKDMLEAFLTPARWDRLCSLYGPRVSLNRGECSEIHLDNLWHLSPHAYGAIREGDIRLEPRAKHNIFNDPHPPGCSLSKRPTSTVIEAPGIHKSYDIRYSKVSPMLCFWGPRGVVQPESVTLCNRAPALAPLPNPELLELHARLSKAMKYTAVSEQIENGWPPAKRRTTYLDTFVFYFLRHVWVRMPLAVRSRSYGLLRKLGKYLYGPHSPATQKIPFNLYLKVGQPARLLNQARAMDLVARHTDVPVPRVVDEIYSQQTSYLLMTSVPGTELSSLLHRLSDTEVAQAAEDLKRHLAQLRRIPKLFSPESVICNAAGQGVYDYRINNSTDRDDLKFDSEAKFNEYLLQDVPDTLHEKAALSHSIPHRIVFTHGDLNMRNILIDKGRISAIVDWENAGWFPEYWEYTKILYLFSRNTDRYLNDIVDKALGGYEKELEVEKMLFNYVDFF